MSEAQEVAKATMFEISVLTALLIEKGVFTEDEYHLARQKLIAPFDQACQKVKEERLDDFKSELLYEVFDDLFGESP